MNKALYVIIVFSYVIFQFGSCSKECFDCSCLGGYSNFESNYKSWENGKSSFFFQKPNSLRELEAGCNSDFFNIRLYNTIDIGSGNCIVSGEVVLDKVPFSINNEIELPISSIYNNADDDLDGAEYKIDTAFHNYIKITKTFGDCKIILGEFQARFVIKEGEVKILDPNAPDTLVLTNGEFASSSS